MVFPTVTGATIVRWIIYQDTGTTGTSQLVALYDTASGLPVIPDGTNISVTWDNGASRIFRI
ncbi:bacteriophage protein [Mycobacteroides abscessus subsp. massiliense CCUG 48898 = JCM 15300]|nr:bacteriophage protein [Mycobacteroides abscessus subsp. massiliense CCUG 48898 = JCM 15300]